MGLIVDLTAPHVVKSAVSLNAACHVALERVIIAPSRAHFLVRLSHCLIEIKRRLCMFWCSCQATIAHVLVLLSISHAEALSSSELKPIQSHHPILPLKSSKKRSVNQLSNDVHCRDPTASQGERTLTSAGNEGVNVFIVGGSRAILNEHACDMRDA